MCTFSCRKVGTGNSASYVPIFYFLLKWVLKYTGLVLKIFIHRPRRRRARHLGLGLWIWTCGCSRVSPGCLPNRRYLSHSDCAKWRMTLCGLKLPTSCVSSSTYSFIAFPSFHENATVLGKQHVYLTILDGHPEDSSYSFEIVSEYPPVSISVCCSGCSNYGFLDGHPELVCPDGAGHGLPNLCPGKKWHLADPSCVTIILGFLLFHTQSVK